MYRIAPDEPSGVLKVSDFAMVTLSRSLHYLNTTDWIISLEKNPLYKSMTRIYLDWRSPSVAISCVPQRDSAGEIVALDLIYGEHEEAKTPIEPGIENSPAELIKRQEKGIHYIELPLDRNIRRVAVCPSGFHFAIATRHTVTVWRYSRTRLEVAYTTTVDFEICLNSFSLSSLSEVCVIKVSLEQGQEDFSCWPKRALRSGTDCLGQCLTKTSSWTNGIHFISHLLSLTRLWKMTTSNGTSIRASTEVSVGGGVLD